ncbi:MAG TPA: CPBP family intramembrane glutamic endopeptidase [Terriglobales bacterium]|nr:CPBP family intramembrane glutamic endopeptidase [Terriglobales bacterium]
MRFGLFTLLTLCGFLIFALTMTFVPLLPAWINYAGRFTLLLIFAGLWWTARGEHSLRRFRPIFFAYFTAVFSLSLGFFLGDWGPWLFGLNMQTPEGVAVAKFSSAFLIVIGVLVTARLCGENLGSLYIRKGRLALGMSVGAAGAAACLLLALRQPAVSSVGGSKLVSLAPWILLFVVANGLMEELLFRGLFLGRYERLIGTWPAIISTALSFTLAHMQVKYAPELIPFLVVLVGLSIAWGWLMQKTRSLWGSAIFHAGADLLIILPIFKTFGAG